MSVTFRVRPDRIRLGGVDEPTLNVSNANARTLLRALGLVPELGAAAVATATHDQKHDPSNVDYLDGECDSSDLLGRVDLALALAPADAGLPWHVLDVCTTECGRRLREIAVYAHTRRRRVDWYLSPDSDGNDEQRDQL